MAEIRIDEDKIVELITQVNKTGQSKCVPVFDNLGKTLKSEGLNPQAQKMLEEGKLYQANFNSYYASVRKLCKAFEGVGEIGKKLKARESSSKITKQDSGFSVKRPDTSGIVL